MAWLWYLYASFMTTRKYPLKKVFYITLGVLMTLWFWAGPVALVISNFVLDNWVRAEVMFAVESGVMIFGFITFLVLTAPLPENQNFPYHTRVNQISQEDYPQHVYEVNQIRLLISNSVLLGSVHNGHSNAQRQWNRSTGALMHIYPFLKVPYFQLVSSTNCMNQNKCIRKNEIG